MTMFIGTKNFFLAAVLSLTATASSASTYNIFIEVGASEYSDSEIGELYNTGDPTGTGPTPSTLRTATVTGTITTDGTLGGIDSTNVLDWNIRMISPTVGVSPSFDVSFGSASGGFLDLILDPPIEDGATATLDHLILDVVQSGTGGSRIQFQQFIAGDLFEFNFGPDFFEVLYNTTEFSSRHVTSYYGTSVDTVTLATIAPATVPLPSSIILLISAFGIFGLTRKHNIGHRSAA